MTRSYGRALVAPPLAAVSLPHQARDVFVGGLGDDGDAALRPQPVLAVGNHSSPAARPFCTTTAPSVTCPVSIGFITALPSAVTTQAYSLGPARALHRRLPAQ